MTVTAVAPPCDVPDATFLGHYEPGTDEWNALRAAAVGGSDVAPILGLSPWDSYFSVWHRKKGNVGPIEETDEMAWGKRLEAVILDGFFHRHPHLRPVLPAGTWASRERPWQHANPDALALDEADNDELVVVEAKTDRYDDEWGEPGTDQIPVRYRCQVMHYLDTLGARRALIPVLITGSDFRVYTLGYDPDEALMMRAACEAFVDSLTRNVTPDIDKHTATYKALRTLHPDIDDVDVEIPAQMAADYLDALAACKAADEAKQHQTNLIADALGRGRRAVDPMGERIAIRVPGRGDNPPFIRPAKTNRGNQS